MALKVLGVYLTLSYLFVCASANLEITEEQFAAFKGVDVTKHCGNVQDMKDECNILGKIRNFTNGKKLFVEGYPTCLDTAVELINSKGGKVNKEFTALVCSWCEGLYLVLGKGQAPKHVMDYVTDTEGVCHPYEDFQYNGN